MNALTKKTLINSILIGIPFLLVVFYSDYFAYLVLILLLMLLVLWKLYFGVGLNWKSASDKSRFLVLPVIFNLGALYLTTLFFQDFVKLFFTVLIIFSNFYLWISLRKVHNLSDRASLLHRNILIVMSFLSVFLGSTTVFRLYVLLSTSENMLIYQSILVVLIFVLFYIVSSFLTWENSGIDDVNKLKPYNIVNSLLGAEVAWISSIWIVNYPVIAIQEKANLGGTPLPAILLTIVFYFLWGIIFHKIDHSLTRRVLTEYILIAILFITVLLVTARWLPTL